MHWLRFAVFTLIATLLQAGLVDAIAVSDIKPDLLLILLVFFAIYCRDSDAIITSFTIGFAADLIGSSMGPKMISFGLLGTLIAYLNRFISLKKMPYQSLVIFTAGFLGGILIHFLSFLQRQPMQHSTYSVLFGTSLYTAIVGPFLFLPLAWWMRITSPKRKKMRSGTRKNTSQR